MTTMLATVLASLLPACGRLGFDDQARPPSTPLECSDPDLVGYWRFDEADGELVEDLSPNQNTATLEASATLEPGDPGRAASLDGRGAHVELGSDPSLDVTGSEVTVVARVRPRGPGAIVDKGGSQQRNYALYLNLPGPPPGFAFYVTTTTGQHVIYQAAVPTLGQWHEVAGVYNGESLALFVDGEQVAAAPVTGALMPTVKTLSFGRRPTDDDLFFLGAIDEVRIYHRALEPRSFSTLPACVREGIP